MAQSDIDAIKTEVGELKTVNASVLALIDGLAQTIRDNADDPAELRAIADSIRDQRTELTAKVTENTPTPPTA